jgi:hypothetical protein
MAKWIDANPFLTYYTFPSGAKAYHTGADLNLNTPTWDADKGASVHAIGNGAVTYAKIVPTGTWGRLVVIRHKLPDGSTVHSRYGHLASLNVTEGEAVKRGDVIGTIGGAEWGLPNHLHFDISTSGILDINPTHWPGTNKAAVVANYVDPKQFLQKYVPPFLAIDLLSYLRGDGRLYEVKHPSGATETFQTQIDGDNFYLVKNSQWEQLYADAEYIWRGADTSPGGGRFFIQYEPGQKRARWMPRRMSVGQSWTGPGHFVQFYNKATCQKSALNSGNATNRMTFQAYYKKVTWNGITVDDVIELTNGTEIWWFARGFGLMAWKSSWGESAIVQVYAPGERPALVREKICSYQL